MNCAICYRDFDPAVNAHIVGRDIYMVLLPDTDKIYAAHLVCWEVRQSNPRTPKTSDWEKEPVPVPDELLGFSNKCQVCTTKIGDDKHKELGFVRLASCTHGYIHLRCATTMFNMRRKLLCTAPQCISQIYKGQHQPTFMQLYTKTINEWTGLPTNMTFKSVSLSVATNTEIDDDVYGLLSEMTIIDMIQAREKANTIVAFYNQTKERVTPAKSLCMQFSDEETRKKCKSASPLRFLVAHKYSGEEIVSLGFTFEMMLMHKKDWNIILDKTIFPVDVLMREKLNITFTRMLLAGMDIGDFIGANYSKEDLVKIEFNEPAFIAALGTKEEYERIKTSISI